MKCTWGCCEQAAKLPLQVESGVQLVAVIQQPGGCLVCLAQEKQMEPSKGAGTGGCLACLTQGNWVKPSKGADTGERGFVGGSDAPGL